MRSIVPGDPASLAAAGGAARRAARQLENAREGARTAYGSLKKAWGTSTSVRTRKEGARSLDVLAEGGRQAEAVGAALQEYAGELSALSARARRLVESVDEAGLTIDGERVVLAWGVRGEADPQAMARRETHRMALQEELDAIAAQHRRRRDRLMVELAESTHELEQLARDLRLG